MAQFKIGHWVGHDSILDESELDSSHLKWIQSQHYKYWNQFMCTVQMALQQQANLIATAQGCHSNEILSIVNMGGTFRKQTCDMHDLCFKKCASEQYVSKSDVLLALKFDHYVEHVQIIQKFGHTKIKKKPEHTSASVLWQPKPKQ